MNTKQKTLLITSALPYANGPIHIGHLLEYIQSDIWVRFKRMQKHTCYHVCADDAHGTPIMLKAQQQGIDPEVLIKTTHQQHKQDFANFFIAFDHFHSTHSEENRELSCMIYKRLLDAGHINKRTIKQAFDSEENMFLPDRFIRGQCPKCNTSDQYGDSCENCGATYSPTELINPISVLSGTTPTEKESEHYFFKLADFSDMLHQWTHSNHLQEEVINKLDDWFASGLQEWDISRDAPYFGFEIPDTVGKYFYVWLDAPIGYLASLKYLTTQRGLDFESFIKIDSDIEMHHFIGKDIIYFHALFWPAILKASGLRTPTAIYAHGFLTVNGAKMSKSRGTFIKASTYLEHLNPEYLRYYFAAKLGNGINDIDLNMEDFLKRVNADLIGKVINIASRCGKFINSRFADMLASDLHQPTLLAEFQRAEANIAADYNNREYSKAMRKIMALADQANQYIDEHKPWVLAKQGESDDQLHKICTMGINLFRILIIYLKPALPNTAHRAEQFLALESQDWQHSQTALLSHKINKFKPLMTRIEQKQIDAMIHASQHQETLAAPAKLTTESPQKQMISIDDLAKIDLRIAKIIEAKEIEGANKLLQLTVDIGDQKRTIFAGIKSSYSPKQLQGKHVVIVANLAPRKMRFGVSEGMVLAAVAENTEIFLITPDAGAKAGTQVK